MKKEYYLLELTKNIFRNCCQHPFICMIIPFYPCLIYQKLFSNNIFKNNFTEYRLPDCFSYDSSIYNSYDTLLPKVNKGDNYIEINPNIKDEWMVRDEWMLRDDWIYIGNDYFISSI
jgi:hypothetical protein